MKEKLYFETFHEFWGIEPTIYSLAGFRLPVAIVLTELIYLGAGFVFMVVLSKIPILNLIQKLPGLNEPAIYYIAAPFMIMKVLGKIKIDGKKPYTYFGDMLMWLLSPKEYEGFKKVEKQMAKNIKCWIPYRKYKIVSKFEYARDIKSNKNFGKIFLVRDRL